MGRITDKAASTAAMHFRLWPEVYGGIAKMAHSSISRNLRMTDEDLAQVIPPP